MSFFGSRWVEVPEGLADVAATADPSLPRGFRASGVAGGLKPSGARDVGLLVNTSVSRAQKSSRSFDCRR